MLLFIILITGIFLLIIWFMIKKDKQDEEKMKRKLLEEPAPIIDVIYYESMTPKDKYKKLIVQLNEVGKLIPLEQKLINLQQHLVEIVKLKQKIDEIYRIEIAQFNNAITWLETPLVSRGKYIPLINDDNESESVEDFKNLVRVLRLTMYQEFDDNCLHIHDESSNVKFVEQVSEKSMFKLFNMNINNLSDAMIIFNRIRPVAILWIQRGFDDMTECINIWYVVFLVARRSVFNKEKLIVAINVMSETMSKYIKVQIEIDNKNDLTTMILEIFPNNQVINIGYYKRFREYLYNKVGI